MITLPEKGQGHQNLASPLAKGSVSFVLCAALGTRRGVLQGSRLALRLTIAQELPLSTFAFPKFLCRSPLG